MSRKVIETHAFLENRPVIAAPAAVLIQQSLLSHRKMTGRIKTRANGAKSKAPLENYSVTRNSNAVSYNYSTNQTHRQTQRARNRCVCFVRVGAMFRDHSDCAIYLRRCAIESKKRKRKEREKNFTYISSFYRFKTRRKKRCQSTR